MPKKYSEKSKIKIYTQMDDSTKKAHRNVYKFYGNLGQGLQKVIDKRLFEEFMDSFDHKTWLGFHDVESLQAMIIDEVEGR